MEEWSIKSTQDVLQHAFHFLLASALALPVGWNREREEDGPGVRTFLLVAVASCAFVMVGEQVLGRDKDSQSRIMQGLLQGIGFIGAGAILRDDSKNRTRGTATAASVWAIGAMGAAVAYRQYDIAVIVSLLNYITLRYSFVIKKTAKKEGEEG